MHAVGQDNFRAGHYKDLTETGNRARKVSGTQGTGEEEFPQYYFPRQFQMHFTALARFGFFIAVLQTGSNQKNIDYTKNRNISFEYPKNSTQNSLLKKRY